MRIVRLLLCGLFFLVGASVAAQPVPNVDYQTLYPAQPTEAGKKVEVIEFFAYYCPHCNALDQPLAEWVTKQSDNIVFKRVHTSVTGEPVPQQRLYYALETMGMEEQYHRKILSAIHFRRLRLDTDSEIIDFMAGQGFERQKFIDVYNSFAVQAKVNHAIRMQADYKITSWPTIVLDGKIVTSPPIVGSKLESYDEQIAQNMMFKVLDGLVAQLHQQRSR